MSTTRKYAIVAVVTATLLLVLFSPFLFSKRTINLVMEGRQVATAERPFGKPRGDVSILWLRNPSVEIAIPTWRRLPWLWI